MQVGLQAEDREKGGHDMFGWTEFLVQPWR